MPSDVLAPKLSALQRAFGQRDLRVVAVYIETCDGVPDVAAAIREQIARHRIDYPALNGEAGRIDDPTRERHGWAPRALVLGDGGKIVRSYPHVPAIEILHEDLADAVAMGWVRPRPHDPWREFPRGASVRMSVEGPGAGQQTRTLRSVSPERVEIATNVAGPDAARGIVETLSVHRPVAEAGDVARVELEAADLAVGERTFRCRVFELRWRDGRVERVFLAPSLRDPLLRREIDSGRVVERVRALAEPVRVGDRAIPCRVVETLVEGVLRQEAWTSPDVPGGEVRREDHARGVRVRALAIDP